MQKLWQKYKVDIAFYGHVHNYERSCPVYQVRTIAKYAIIYFLHCMFFMAVFFLLKIVEVIYGWKWSLYRDYDFGFVKLTAFDHSSLLFEYKKSSDRKVYDSFTISRNYKDVLACVHDG
ncbi:putative phosphodiesterase I [Lupinus albus]|uniref:Putative phosphodiesterase I n=1 Tax=Lupinus albus TaxID=3870 RepID=A0A6A4Q893_LUPAL|nr:putative phosphodiesterase I [Lupinus albus]